MKKKWNDLLARMTLLMMDCRGEGYVDTGIKIVISVVIGGLLLTGLYALFQLTILPNLETKIQELFSYGG